MRGSIFFVEAKAEQNKSACKNTVVHSITVFVTEYEYWLFHIWKTLFPDSPLLRLAVIIAPLSLTHRFLRLEERFNEDIPFGSELSKDPHSLPNV